MIEIFSNIKNNHLEPCTENFSHKKSALVRADIFFERHISSQKIPLIEEHLLRDDNSECVHVACEKKKTSPIVRRGLKCYNYITTKNLSEWRGNLNRHDDIFYLVHVTEYMRRWIKIKYLFSNHQIIISFCLVCQNLFYIHLHCISVTCCFKYCYWQFLFINNKKFTWDKHWSATCSSYSFFSCSFNSFYEFW